jgi:creatinase
MLHVMEWHNGDKDYSPFSDAEMTRRQEDVRRWMAANDVDAALFTSYHCINYYSGWLYCAFGRKYGMVITQDNATTISAGIDGGQPWRRSFGGNVTYTDWRRDNFYRAVRQLTPGVSRLGIEFDHVNLDYRKALEAALPGVEFVDIAQPSMWMRSIKSAEEHTLIRTGARICDVSGWAAWQGGQGGRAGT